MSSLPAEREPISDCGDGWLTTGRFALLLALSIIAVFPGVAFGYETFFYRDFGVIAYPSVFHHHQSFWRGELPLWNPLSNCGAPFLAQWGTMVLYPFSVIYLLFPLPWSLNFFCLAHLFWGGVGAYVLALRWTGSRAGASVAGFAFVFNGVTFSCLLWPNYLVALGWMPWVIWMVEKGWREGGRWLVGATFVAAFQVLSGVPEAVMLTWLLLAGLWFVILCDRSVVPRDLVARLAFVVVLAGGLTAIQLWPFWDLLQHSQRDRAFATAKWSMPVSGIANLLVPQFRSFQTAQGIFFQIGQQFFSSTYLGIGTLALAAFAIAFVRKRLVWLLGGAAVLGLVFALGENGFIYRWIKEMFPMMGFARYPIKFMLLPALVVPLLAAYGFAELKTRVFTADRGNPTGFLFVAAFLLACIGGLLFWVKSNPLPSDQWAIILQGGVLRGVVLLLLSASVFLWGRMSGRGRQIVPIIILALVAGDTVSHAPRQNPTLPSNVMAPGLWEAAHQLQRPKFGESRVMITATAEEILLKSGVRDFQGDFVGKRLALWSHLNLIEGVAKVNGSSTLQVREQARVQSLLYASTNTHFPGVMDFLGASYASAESNAVAWVARTNSMPLVTAGQVPVFADANDSLAGLTNAQFNPRRTVYLPLEAEGIVKATNSTEVVIRYQEITSHRIRVELEAGGPALMVIAQSHYPAWKAYLGERQVPVWRANHAFQAIEIPGGTHELIVTYRDWHFIFGATISGATCLLLLGIARRTRRNDGERNSGSQSTLVRPDTEMPR